jgi:GNAT superfamily N-acetyltransferase
VPDDYLDSLSVWDRWNTWISILGAANLPRTGTYVLEHDDRIAGFVNVGPSRDEDSDAGEGEVTGIYVHPDWWRHGGGSLLLAQATETLRAAGFSSAILWVLMENIRARCFYEDAGWVADGAVKEDRRGAFCLHQVRYRRPL